MKRSLHHRTATAIALMAVLFLTVGAFALPTPHATHSCCPMGMPADPPAKPICCTAAPQIPPVVVTAPYPGTVFLHVDPARLPADLHPVSRTTVAATILPPQSPPPGAVSLRI